MLYSSPYLGRKALFVVLFLIVFPILGCDGAPQTTKADEKDQNVDIAIPQGGLLRLEPDPEAASKPLPAVLESPSIVVFKAQRRLLLYSGTILLRSYRTALGLNPVPPKTRVKDFATPEGVYYVCVKNPQSQFYLSLGINYPNSKDAERAFHDGRISKQQYNAILAAEKKKRIPPWNTALGGEIFIHGGGVGQDWTWGCVALDNKDMKELYAAIPVGTPVTINP